jgi:transposase
MNDTQRYYYRRHFAKKKTKRLFQSLKRHQNLVPPKSPVTTAINYALNHWKALTNYLRDGVLVIDNNLAERMMKSVVIGRKNYLFSGNHNAAEHAVTLYSLIETCKLLNINTYDYFTDVLKRLPTTM